MTFPIKKRIYTLLFIGERLNFKYSGARKIRAKVKRVKSLAPKNTKRLE